MLNLVKSNGVGETAKRLDGETVDCTTPIVGPNKLVLMMMSKNYDDNDDVGGDDDDEEEDNCTHIKY